MQLQPNEQTITSSNGNRVILTNLRVCGSYSELGHSNTVYIYLEDISSIGSVYRSMIVLLLLAIACGLFSLVYFLQMDAFDGPGMLAAIIGLLLAVFWWFSRRRIISIHPNGGKPLELEANSMREEQVEDFMEKVQLAKTARLKELYKLP